MCSSYPSSIKQHLELAEADIKSIVNKKIMVDDPDAAIFIAKLRKVLTIRLSKTTLHAITVVAESFVSYYYFLQFLRRMILEMNDGIV